MPLLIFYCSNATLYWMQLPIACEQELLLLLLFNCPLKVCHCHSLYIDHDMPSVLRLLQIRSLCWINMYPRIEIEVGVTFLCCD